MHEDDKARFVAVQFVLWIAYASSAVVAHLDINSPWSLALVIVTAVLIPFVSTLYYYILPWIDAQPWARKTVQSLWISVTTGAILLFGVSTYEEGASQPFAAKLGSALYFFTIVWSHTGLYQDGNSPKLPGKNLFTAYVAISGLLYVTASFFLAFHPEFVAWRLILPIVSLFGLLGWLSYFSGHFQGSWPATSLLVFVTSLPVFLYGITLSDMENESYDETYSYVAIGGTVVLVLTFPVVHWWLGDKHSDDAGGNTATNSLFGSLVF